ncbi:NAD(P)-dependent dehydrogenase, short-chain alcohol dehydrogenase family [Streptoalloteichus tenebrarius]|uniref:NAD(P)-dependent dehydrogenase, short-chain alcohol dehydrogenase family n=1 Tax=Streptoalloteichus tenebrarius (strain ATCC 17920 / DSM 40477 / JCM 4838 / CBS 697.72 / NBRC 16177 / NCIMB 11028 / NRRL B-12390 / A12253. 1 / ISP 5477) TaxID=1933 RepID=A0ABT1HMQ0_STRSD|nr:glucose 1-dehydrogenase [Streptoalloteichus tenebrarius]MCP2256797.1 NAD(P)-dependent dehydrogenase, short-chain alcohol dehydrogenase family [Streptoalloteichus tenebrarius]BFF00297.1 glucose 1-dehydrogenase [Streptoalloteichus tenebrarius]
MSTQFADKVVLVTGAGSGIGRAVVVSFAREGATVVAAGRRAEPLAETVRLAEAEGASASFVTVDVADEADVARMVETVVSRHGGLHVAVNNAGTLGAPAPLADLDEATWSSVLGTNLTGTWLSMKHEIRHMRANGGGVIVNIASNVGPHITKPGVGAYGASKAGVLALTRAAALECVGDGVRVSAVSPGAVDTPMSMRPGETEEDRAARMRETIPAGRVATTEEIAATVRWLASDEASFVIGRDIVIDGGASA